MADIEALKRALVNADRAGDTAAARALAGEIRKQMGGASKQPEPMRINPTDGMSTTEKVLAGIGKAFVDAGRGVGQMVGLVDQKDVDEAKRLDQALMDTGAGTAGNIIGNIAALAPTVMIPGANTVRGAALINSLAGAMITPGSIEDRGQAAMYGGTGGALGVGAGKLLAGTAKAANAAAAPLTKAGQERIVGEVMRRAAGENVDDVISRMRGASELVPGSAPTAAEVAESGGMAALQRAMSQANPEAYTQRGMQSASARVNALRGIAKDEQAMQAAIAAREAAASPLYAAADKAVVTSDDALRDILNRLPNGTMEQAKNIARMEGRPIQIGRDVPAQTIFKDAAGELIDPALMKAPRMEVKPRSLLDEIKKAGGIRMDELGELNMTPIEAVKGNPGLFRRDGMSADGLLELMQQQGWIDEGMIARANEYDTGGALELAKDYIRTALSREPVYHPSQAMELASQSQAMQDFAEFASKVTRTDIPAKNAQYTGRGLDLIKKGIDEAISPTPGSSVGKHQQRAGVGVKQALTDWADANIPEYAAARQAWAEGSKPIDQMKIGQELLNKMQGPLADHGALASETGAMYARALNDVRGNLVKNATGGIKRNIEDVMTPDQMATLNNVAQDLARKSNAQNLGRGVGSNTFQNFAMDNLAAQSGMPSAVSVVSNLVPGLGTVGNLAKATGNLIYKSKDELMKQRMADLLLNPQAAAEVMENAVKPGAIGQALQNAIGMQGVEKLTTYGPAVPGVLGAAFSLPYGSQ